MSTSIYAAIIFFSTLFILLIVIAIYDIAGRRNFDWAVHSGKMASAEKLYKRHFQNPSNPEGAIRKILWQVINKTPPEEFAKSVKETLPFIPFQGYEKITERAKEVNISFDSQSRQNFHLGEFRFLADLLSGSIPKEITQPFKIGFEKFTIGTVVVKKYLNQPENTERVIEENKYHDKFGLSCELGCLYDSEAKSKIDLEFLSNGKFILNLAMSVFPGKLATQKYDFDQAFELNNLAVTNFMNNISRDELLQIVGIIPRYKNLKMIDILKIEEKKLIIKILQSLAEFISKRELGESIEKMIFKFQDGLPFFWREDDSKFHLVGNYTEHHYRVNMIFHQMKVELQFDMDGSLFKEKLEKIMSMLDLAIDEHISFSLQ